MGVIESSVPPEPLVLVWLSDRRAANGFRIKYLRGLDEAKALVMGKGNVIKVSLHGEVMDRETFLSRCGG